MKASIIISISDVNVLTYNFFHTLKNYENIKNYEIIVVCDFEYSSIDADNFFQKFDFKNLKYFVLDKKQGYGKANNFGVKQSSYDILLFMNDDIILTPCCLEILIDDIKQQKADAVQPKLLFPQTHKIQSTGHTFTRYNNAHLFANASTDNPFVNQSNLRAALTTALCATRKDIFVALGGFDEYYYNAWEGMEYFLKLTHMGYKCLYESSAIAYHIRGGSRGLYKINENPQSAYFWSKWKDIIPEDLVHYHLIQLDNKDLGKNYIVLNFSSLPTTKNLLEQERFNIVDEVYYVHYSGLSSIDFFKTLPIGMMNSSFDFIYFCDNYSQIINNKLWFQQRNRNNDLILDLSGNVIKNLPNS